MKKYLTNPELCDILKPSKERRYKQMTEYREKLLERVIRVYGFEHEITIGFARLCENTDFSDACLEALCIAHECFPYYEE